MFTNKKATTFKPISLLIPLLDLLYELILFLLLLFVNKYMLFQIIKQTINFTLWIKIILLKNENFVDREEN